MAKRPARVIQFAEIEQRFTLANLTLGEVHPAVARATDGTYSIRVLVSSTSGSYRARSEKYAYFYLDPEGTITEAPRGFAKEYKPGRVLVEELDAAVARYAEAVSRG